MIPSLRLRAWTAINNPFLSTRQSPRLGGALACSQLPLQCHRRLVWSDESPASAEAVATATPESTTQNDVEEDDGVNKKKLTYGGLGPRTQIAIGRNKVEFESLTTREAQIEYILNKYGFAGMSDQN